MVGSTVEDMPITQADVAATTAELQQKTRAQIETETADKWGARAVAAYGLFVADKDTRWLSDAIEYAHEAVEHAAAAEEAGAQGVLAPTRTAVDSARKHALGW